MALQFDWCYALLPGGAFDATRLAPKPDLINDHGARPWQYTYKFSHEKLSRIDLGLYPRHCNMNVDILGELLKISVLGEMARGCPKDGLDVRVSHVTHSMVWFIGV